MSNRRRKRTALALAATAVGIIVLAIAAEAWLREPDIPALVQRLRDPDPSARTRALYSLGRRDSLSPVACGALVRTLEDRKIRDEAIPALIGIGRRGQCIREMASLVECATDSPSRIAAMQALGGSGRAAWTASSVLLAVLEISAPERAEAARALGSVGDTATRVTGALEQLFRHGSPEERVAALDALATLGDLTRLASDADMAISDADPAVRAQGVAAMELVIAAGQLSLDRLLPAVHDSSADVRAAAIESLGRLSTRIPAARSELVRLLSDSDPDVRNRARRALNTGVS